MTHLNQRSYWTPGPTLLTGLYSKRMSKAMTEIENVLLKLQRSRPAFGDELIALYELGQVGECMELLIDRVRLDEDEWKEQRGPAHARYADALRRREPRG